MNRNHILKLALMPTLLMATLTGCGGGGSDAGAPVDVPVSAAPKMPTKPVIAPLAAEYELADTPVAITVGWTTTAGHAGDHWQLLQNGDVIHKSELATSDNGQSGSVGITLATAGEYQFIVRLCDGQAGFTDVCNDSNVVTVAIQLADAGDDGSEPDVGDGPYLLVSEANANRCVAVSGTALAGASVSVASCDGAAAAQQWSIYRNSLRPHGDDSLCLSANVLAAYGTFQLATCAEDDNQHWTWGDGEFRHDELAIDLANGNQLLAYPHHGGANQRWHQRDPASVSATVPAAAANVLATLSANPAGIAVTWTDMADNETGYRVHRQVDGGSWTPVSMLAVNSQRFTDVSVQAGHQYRYRVIAFNDAGDSAAVESATVTVMAAPTVPAAVSGLQRTAKASPPTIELTWLDNARDETGVRIQRQVNAGAWSSRATLAANATTFTDSEVVAGSSYTYRVTAFNAVGDATVVQSESVTVPAPPSPLLSGDVLVSESSPQLCIATSGTVQAGSAVTIMNCDGDAADQRWELQNATVRPASNVALCVTAAGLSYGKTFSLQSCSGDEKQRWQYVGGQLRHDNLVFDLSSTPTLSVYGAHTGANQRWNLLSVAAALVEQNHSKQVSYPIPLSDKTTLQLEQARDLVNRLDSLAGPLSSPRDISVYPGAVSAGAERVSRRYAFNRKVSRYSHTGWTPEWYNTLHAGLYAAAGDVITVTVTGASVEVLAGARLRINSQDDVLDIKKDSINGSAKLERFANVTATFPLQTGTQQVRSQYGGMITLESMNYVDASIDVTISGAVEAAYFRAGVHGNADWAAIRNRPTPWVTLEGERAVVTVPRTQVSQLADPVGLMKVYDQHVNHIEWLAGFDGSSTQHPVIKLKQHLLWDPQIVAGYGHAGYPIMVSSSWRLADLATAPNNWGNVHEIGHNYQPFCLWSSTYGTESNVNLFSLYALERQGVVERTITSKNYSAAIKKLNADSSFSFVDDADVWDKLIFFMQIKHAFPDQGWQIFRTLYRRYRELPATELSAICNDKQKQWDTNMELLSDITAADLTEHYQRWGVPVSAAAVQRVKARNFAKPASAVWQINPEP